MNIVVVMLDSLRPDFMGCYGNSEVKTPYMDAIAAGGTAYAKAYAEYPITVPARTALVSGCYTFTNRPWCPLRSYDMHIAEVLKENGYVTGAFSDTPFTVGANMDRGFDTFEWVAVGKCHRPVAEGRDADISDTYFPPHATQLEKNFYKHTMINRDYSMEVNGKICPELLFDSAIEWMEANADKKFFLWIDTFEPHEPWCPVPPYDTMYQEGYEGKYIPMPMGPSSDWMTEEDVKHVRALYAGEATHTDQQVGILADKIDELGLRDDTLIVLISDHGEPLADHGTIRKYGVPVYEELARMVWIMSKPGLVPEGVVSDALVQNTDLAPTILEMLNIEPLPRYNMDGVSLVPLLNGEKEAVREYVYNGAFGLRASIVNDEWKFIDNRGEKANELFDRTNDPLERENLVEQHPDLAEKLHGDLWKFESRWARALSWRDRPRDGTQEGQEMDDQEKKQDREEWKDIGRRIESLIVDEVKRLSDAASPENWVERGKKIEDKVKSQIARAVGAPPEADWDEIGRNAKKGPRESVSRWAGAEPEDDWKTIGKKTDANVRSQIADIVGAEPDDDWVKIGKQLESRIKAKIRNWLKE
ncbi:sulfatase [Candidatus Poribacteria bacterium]